MCLVQQSTNCFYQPSHQKTLAGTRYFLHFRSDGIWAWEGHRTAKGHRDRGESIETSLSPQIQSLCLKCYISRLFPPNCLFLPSNTWFLTFQDLY